jgi:hypothetical protein
MLLASSPMFVEERKLILKKVRQVQFYPKVRDGISLLAGMAITGADAAPCMP